MSKEDVFISEAEGETSQDKRKVGRVKATFRQDKAEVTSTMVTSETAYNDKKKSTKEGARKPESVNGEPKTPQGGKTVEKKNTPTPAANETAHSGKIKANEEARKMAGDGKPKEQDKKYTEEEKNAHESRIFPTPKGWRANWNDVYKQWYYSTGKPPHERSVWGNQFRYVVEALEENRQGTDTAGKISSGSESRKTENPQVNTGIPEKEEVTRKNDDTKTGGEIRRERAKEKVVEKPEMQEESDKEKRRRATSRSPERLRDKIGRAKSTMRRGSRERERKYKSRSETREGHVQNQKRKQ